MPGVGMAQPTRYTASMMSVKKIRRLSSGIFSILPTPATATLYQLHSPPGFEGGQTPLARRLPKLKGFKNPNREEFAVVNLGALSVFDQGSVVTPDTLRDTGLAKRRGKIKIRAEGELASAITIEAHAFSAAARRKIEEVGGKWEIVG